ncbi:MAG: hypothetical protein LUI87_08955 [Lachnospiraceae bacterium]|nr:hypothetical protein [Lachnospiraceae bacterium]
MEAKKKHLAAADESAAGSLMNAYSSDGKIGGQGREQDSASFQLFSNKDNFADAFNHDVHRMSESELDTYGDEMRVVFGFVKYARQKERLQAFIKENEDAFSNVSETAVCAISDLAHSAELEKIQETSHVINERGNYDMCQALREWMEDSKNEGREEGRREGWEEGRKFIEMESRRADQAEQRAYQAEQELLMLKKKFGIA